MPVTLRADPFKSPYAMEFDVMLQGWIDERHLSRKHLYALWVFTTYLENVAESQDWRYDGHSWKNSSPLGTLVVKATIDAVPVVCFTSARTNLKAITIFVGKLIEDSVMWVKDKYRV